MANDVILYKTDDGKSAIELHLDNGTVWLTQQELAELFQTSKQNISKHIKAIFEDSELDETVVVNYQLTTTRHGVIAGKTQSKKSHAIILIWFCRLAIVYPIFKIILKKVKNPWIIC